MKQYSRLGLQMSLVCLSSTCKQIASSWVIETLIHFDNYFSRTLLLLHLKQKLN